MTTRARHATSALLILLALPVRLRAEDKWYELYQDGVKAIQNRKWAEAEKKLKGAIAGGPVSGRQVRMYGVRFIDYLPEYELGIAYFNQQRYADALEQFAKVQAAGYVTKNDAEFPSLTDMLELCRIRTAGITKPAEPQKDTEGLVKFARDLMNRGSLEEARRALDSAAAKNPGAPDVIGAREDLVRLETEKRMQQERAANEAGRAEQERALEAASRAVDAGRLDEARAQLAKLPAADTRAKELRAELEFRQGVADVSALIAAKKWTAAEARRRSLASARPGRPELAELQARIEQGLTPASAPGKAAEGASADLEHERGAYAAFYSGDYAGAATRFEALAGAAAAPKRERFLAYAACSRAGAALLKGTAGESELAQARRAYADAGAAGSRVVERDTFVSPSILRALAGARP